MLSFLDSPPLTSIQDYGKNKALTRWTFVDKVMSLLFNMLSRSVITFHPRTNCFLISRLQSPSVVILEPPKLKFVTVSIVSLSICHEVVGPGAIVSRMSLCIVHSQVYSHSKGSVIIGSGQDQKPGSKMWL